MRKTVIDFDVIDSTNDHLKTHYQGYPSHTFVRARFQNRGRGQFDRQWVSDFDQNLLFSMLLKHVDVTVLETIRHRVKDILLTFLEAYGIKASFKAPNDIYVRNKKIAGVLIETKGTTKTMDAVMIGIGLNVNQLRFEGIDATSMAIESGETYPLDDLFDCLSSRLDEKLPTSP
ncbi:MAG: biotin--[acetyl-CoA-carboxylase] ligase [Acholeplasmataceae bacterium]|nr:biotin--[acetyl-CoA-carboxylase] ligase [Acholeplasmataceae bacterium]